MPSKIFSSSAVSLIVLWSFGWNLICRSNTNISEKLLIPKHRTAKQWVRHLQASMGAARQTERLRGFRGQLKAVVLYEVSFTNVGTYFFHGHQFTGVNTDTGIDFPILTFSCKIKKMMVCASWKCYSSLVWINIPIQSTSDLSLYKCFWVANSSALSYADAVSKINWKNCKALHHHCIKTVSKHEHLQVVQNLLKRMPGNFQWHKIVCMDHSSHVKNCHSN